MGLIGFYDYTVIVTYISLISAVAGILLTTQKNLNGAIVCLLVAGVCDAFDGAIARTKKNRTEEEKMFGIQLDSLCDVISFGVFPAVLCFYLGMNGTVGVVLLMVYCLCAVIRLAFFNVIEAERQKTETGSNKMYRGLPVTTISMVLPALYVCRNLMTEPVFVVVLHFIIGLTAFLFVLDFKVKKFQVTALFKG